MIGAWPSATLVTPTRRLAHFLRRRHDDACHAQGLDLWRTPDIVTWAELIERLFARSRETGHLHGRWLPADAARLVWRRIVLADPLTAGLVVPGSLAYAAYQSWHRLHDYAIPERALAGGDSPEEVAFAHWCARYRSWLDEYGWVDPAVAVDGVAAPERGTRLEFAGFDVLTPAQTAFVARMKSSGIDVAVEAAESRAGQTRRVECRDRVDEWDTAARWAARHLDEDPRCRLAIVVPGLRERRTEVRRVIERVLAPQATITGGPAPASTSFELAAAGKLAERPVVAAALDLIDAFIRPLDLAGASRLLCNRFLAGALEEADARARLDARVRRHEGPDLGHERLAQLAGERRCPDLERALRAGITQARNWPRRALPNRWSHLWFDLLAAVGWPGADLDSDEHQAQQRWQSLLGEFGACDDFSGPLRASESAALLRDMAQGVLFESQELRAPLLVIDPETCAGMSFDGVWICGLDAARWPAPAAPDPFLPREWQSRQGVPGATAQIAAAQARRTLDRLLSSADDVIASVPSFEDETPLLPSALLADLPCGTAIELWDRPTLAAASFAARPPSDVVADGWMPARSGQERTRGGARLLELQAACPFRAQAELRLGAAALEDPGTGIDATERGDLLHDVLARLWNELRDQNTLHAQPVVELRARVRSAIEAETRAARESAGDVLRHLLELESGWLEARVLDLLRADLSRPPFVVAAVEQEQEVRLGDLTLALRLDRVDRLGDDSLVVIDYKTGADADVSAWRDERLKLPQLPLYAEAVGPGRVAAVAFGRVRTGDTGYRGLARDAECFPGLGSPGTKQWPREFASWEELLQAWHRRLESLAREYSSGEARLAPDPPNACRYCHLAALCRIGEAQPGATVEGAGDE
jgi:probable DNA repair protein